MLCVRPIWSCLALGSLAVSTQATAQQHMNFLTCPVAQDTGEHSDVCFFVMQDGVRYGVSLPIDWGNPQLGHQLLVEGVVDDSAQECGGVRIDGRASVMPELSPQCNEIAPATPEILALGLGRRPGITPEQRAMIAADPSSSLQVMRLRALPVPEVALGHTETIYFAFESDRATAPDAMLLLELARLAEATPGVQITVRAYRGATLLDNGNTLMEKPGIAQQRGEKLAGILVGLGAPEGSITVETFDASASSNGKEDWKSRSAELTVSAPN